MVDKIRKEINNLPIQNSVPYNRYGPYQCSWFAVGCVSNKQKLLETWMESTLDQFVEVYIKILEEATHMRGTTNPEAYHIQTLFYQPLMNYWKLDVERWFHHVLNDELPDLITENYAKFLTNAYEVKNTKLQFPKQTFKELEEDLRKMNHEHSFLAHRNGQAFVGLPIPGSNNDFLLLDDHFPRASSVTVDELIDYVKKVPDGTYQIFFWTTTAKVHPK